jgi:hypothetical protein
MPVAASGEAKKDIRGFYAGMTVDQFVERTESFLNGGDKPNVLFRLFYETTNQCLQSVWRQSGITCKLNGETFDFKFTATDMNNRLLEEIVLHFKSSTDPEEMVRTISDQYGPPSDLSGINVLGLSRFLNLMVAAELAKWDLRDEIVLELRGINDYELHLYSQKIMRLDAEAAKPRSVNPSPKF